MKRFGLVLLATSVLAGAQAAPRNRAPGAIPELDYVSTCKATPPVAMDRDAQLKSCLNDEKQAKADLPKQWERSKSEWRSSCVRQTTLGGLASYVELITCLEMHDPNPPSLKRPSLSGVPPAPLPPSAAPDPSLTGGTSGSVKAPIGSPRPRGATPQ